MSAYTVIVTRLAADDAAGMIRYISGDLKNVQAAKRHLDLYLETVESLGEFPNRYAISSLSGLYEKEIRLVPFGNYVIAYSVDDSQKTVTVLRVLYGLSDLESKLGQDGWTE